LRAEKLANGGGGPGGAKSWSAVVHVVLVQATGLTAMDAGETSDPYCKLSLGRDRHKSKAVSGTVNPKWREGFDLYWYEGMGQDDLEVSVWDKDIGSKDDFMGRYYICCSNGIH